MTDVPAIETDRLTLRFGHFTAVNEVSLRIAQGARHAIIGPNGAGKTSLVSALTGSVPATSGRITLNGHDVTALRQAQRVRQGLARTFQINQLFVGLTVQQNVEIALIERMGESQVFWRAMTSCKHITEEAKEILAAVQLAEFAEVPVRSLAYGQRRLIEIAIALACRPRVLILDEPAAGVPAAQSEQIFERISALPRDVTLIFIEHDMNLVFRFAERITVLVAGQVLTDGTPAQIRADERVREVYLGQRGHHALA